MDVMNMVVTNTLLLASPGTDVEYDTVILNSQSLGNTFLNKDGKISFKDMRSACVVRLALPADSPAEEECIRAR